MATNLNDAIADLIETLRADGYTDGIVDKTAADWDVNPQLLARMFETKYGKPASEFAIRSRAELREIALAFANKLAAKQRARFTQGSAPEVLGKSFTHDGIDYIAVVISDRGLRVVRVDNCGVYVFGRNGREAHTHARRKGLI